MIVKVGADPEYGIQCKRTGDMIPVQNIPEISGTKYDPLYLTPDIFVSRDNVAVEFGISPSASIDVFVNKVMGAKDRINSILANHNCKIYDKASAHYHPKYLLSEEAQEFGCERDYNAWRVEANPRPTARDQTLRSFGAHLHFSIDQIPDSQNFLLHDQGKVNFIRFLDLTLGMVLTACDSSEESLKRRELYGKAGCYRPTSYGVEYRTPSNWWALTSKRSSLVAQIGINAVEFMNRHYDGCARLVGKLGDRIQEIINTGDKKSAIYFLTRELIAHLGENNLTYHIVGNNPTFQYM